MITFRDRERAREIFVARCFRQKPQYPRPYLQWLEDKFSYNIENFGEADYASASSGLKAAFTGSPFWEKFGREIEALDRYFLYFRGAFLFARVEEKLENFVPIGTKRFESLLKKTHRFNVVVNENWPNAPKLGWVTPWNWCEKINDVVRGQVVTRQMDGAIFLAQKLKEFAEQTGTSAEVSYRAYDDGYYAIHIYVDTNARVLRKSRGRYEWIKGRVELQITTQMHETIKQMLHKDYRGKRNTMGRQQRPWQWRYEDREFVLNFVGHGLQNMDGIICRLRGGKGID